MSDDWSTGSSASGEEEWRTAGENVQTPSGPPAPDNQPGVPGWLWLIAAGAAGAGLLSCGLVAVGLFLIERAEVAVFFACGAAALALVALLLALRALPLLIAAATGKRPNRER